MQAVIIAGGKGTRLSPLTLRSPKPMLPLFERPFLCWMVERCQQVGLTDILMNIRYQATQIQDYFGDGHDFGVQIRYVIETEALDTAGAMKLAEPFYTGEPLVVFNADILTDLDLKTLMQVHEQTQAQATIALARVADPTAFGLVELADLTSSNGHTVGTIRSFREKPTAAKAAILGIDTVNAGTYVLNPDIFGQYVVDQPLSFERTVFPHLLANQQKITGLVWEGYWLDLGTPAKFYSAHLDILQKTMPFPLPPGVQEIQPQVWVARTATIHPQARLSPPCFVGEHTLLGSQAELSSGAIVGACCLVDRPLPPGIYPAGTLAV
ncbi:MAG: NDP-sugar synthase [Acaryochloris sp. RU_4_1]|nr:NDP-sugar synthase [Acaryochloris sp. RU_4_1]NJR55884.1 NDP-sugar synthase [Acaryochloris sp. CRU_2_0]